MGFYSIKNRWFLPPPNSTHHTIPFCMHSTECPDSSALYDDEYPNWEGYTLAGGEAKLGVYVWTLSVVTEDGSVEELNGTVTLLQ